ncbi:MAG: DUF4124 domain-containing protein [Gammaproteobacteria bacterium]|nr:DUF4124 domain-containing protein [Gammaproteobacteria bacterium]
MLLTASLLLPIVGTADAVFKSVDKDGKITYSSSPTEDHQQSVKVNIQPPPSDEAVKAAQERHQQNLKTDKMLDESRKHHAQEVAEKNRLRREKKKKAEIHQKPEKPKEQGPYYGIPGHGIIVLPKGAGINRNRN